MDVILTHEHADFDAVASVVGMARLLPEAVAVLPQHVNQNVRDFLTLYGSELRLVPRADLPRRRVTHAWIVDTRKVQSVRGMSQATRRTVIDHHAEDDAAALQAEDPQLELDVQAVGATSTLVCERLATAGAGPSEVEATLLLLGIHEDTGSMTFAGTTPRDLRAAAWLLGHGADASMVAPFLRRDLSESARAFMDRLEENAVRLDVCGHVVVVATGESRGFDQEIATVASRMLEAERAAALFVLVDMGSHVQLVARGADELVNVGAVAEALGGGGHNRAAAAVIRSGGLEAATRAVIAELPSAVRAAALVRDIMSRGAVQTLGAELPVQEAAHIARRYPHEGFPVVEGSRVIGLVTRHDLDRAMSHRMGQTPVGQLASPVPTVAPEDSVLELQRRMMDHDAGQVPVLEGGRLVGIVTRTDVLRHWATQHAYGGGMSPLNLAQRLEETLSAGELQRVRQVAQIAAERGEHAYLVGGLPRDLVLGQEHVPDIDLVIVGDAVQLARTSAERYGGRVTVRHQFGTAKWSVDETNIDLVSARTEYYCEPTALPSVARGTLRSDLRRRDFTINTLAVALDPDRFGQVIDDFHALADIGARRIRVLHSLSFVEDPTRILRAVRFRVRLGFEIDDRTLRLARDAVGLLGKVSGARIREELLQLMKEPDPADGLRQLEAFGALEAVEPGLEAGTRTPDLLRDLPEAWRTWRQLTSSFPREAAPGPELMMAAWLTSQGQTGVRAAARLRLRSREVAWVGRAGELLAAPSVVAQARAPAPRLYHELSGTPPVALMLAWLCAKDEAVRGNLVRYARDLAAVKTTLTGADLAALGVPPGRVYGRVLRAVLEARLEGRATTHHEELELAKAVLREEGALP